MRDRSVVMYAYNHYSGKYCRNSRHHVVKLKSLIDAYTGPYKDKYQFWNGVLLIMHLILIPVFSYTTGTNTQLNNYIIAIVSFTLLAFVRGKYRNKWNTALEFFYLFNLGFTCIIVFYQNQFSNSTIFLMLYLLWCHIWFIIRRNVYKYPYYIYSYVVLFVFIIQCFMTYIQKKLSTHRDDYFVSLSSFNNHDIHAWNTKKYYYVIYIYMIGSPCRQVLRWSSLGGNMYNW